MGAILSIERVWQLASAWYRDRLAPDWRRRTPAEAQALLDSIGLTDPFWRLGPPLLE